MPRKKVSEVTTGRPLSESPALRVFCPACKSEISSDGATLHAMSKYLDELIETEADVEKLEKVVAEWEQKAAAAKAEIQKLKQEAQTKPEEKKNASTVEQTGDKPKRGGFFDGWR